MRAFSVFNLAFLGGLLLSARVVVAAVVVGVSEGQSLVRSRWAVPAGMLTLAGFIGSLLLRVGASAIAVWSGVIIAAVAGGWIAWILVSRAAAPVRDHEFDAALDLQGVPTTAKTAIPADDEV